VGCLASFINFLHTLDRDWGGPDWKPERAREAALIQINLRNLRKCSEVSAMIASRSPASNNTNVTILLVGGLMRPVKGVDCADV
jgi:hypothetical protein